MNKVLFFFSLFIITVLGACKSSGEEGAGLDSAEGSPYNEEKGGYTQPLDEIRTQCLSLIQFRKQSESKAYSFLTTGYWHPQFIFNKGEFSKEGQYEGYWLQFTDDFKYAYGLYDKVIGGGDYHYSLNQEQMIMVDRISKLEPKIWKIQYNGDHLVMVGTHEFGINNGMQIKNIPIEEKPVKPAK